MGNGWSNDIPNPFVVGGGGEGSGEIDVVDGSNRVIMKMNSVGLLVFDTAGNIIGSIAPTAATVNGQEVVSGIGSYDRTLSHVQAQLNGGALFFEPRNNTINVSAELGIVNPNGITTQAAQLFMESPTTNPDSVSTVVSLFGNSADGTSQTAQIQIGRSDLNPAKVVIQGELVYGSPSSLNYVTPETWHVPVLNANWGTTAGYPPLQYRRNASGGVDFAGVTQWNASATAAPLTIFTLPAGYRPNFTRELSVRNMPASGTAPTVQGIQVLTTGDVVITDYVAATGPMTPVTFDDVSFALVVHS